MGGVNNIPIAFLLILLNTTTIFTLLIVYAVQYPVRYIQRRLLSNRRRPPRARVFLTTNESQRDGDAHDTVVLVHGFPDGPALWRATVRRLTALGYRCLVVALPGCRGQQVEQPLGIDVIVDQLHDAIVGELETAQAAQQHADDDDDDDADDEVEEKEKEGEGQQKNENVNENEGNNINNNTDDHDSTIDSGTRRRQLQRQRRKQRQKSVTVIAHDWGVAFTQFLQRKYPNLVHRVVLLDVGQMNIMRTDMLWKLSLISYQLMFACCYLVGNPIGTVVLRAYITVLMKYDGRPASELRSDMAWVYVTFMQYYMSLALAGKKTGRSSKSGVQEGGDVNINNNNSAGGGDDDDRNNNKTLSSSSSSSPSSSTITTTRPPSSSSDMSSDRPSSTLTATSAGRAGAGMKIPTLFIYGRQKPFKFHEDRYVERVRSIPHSVAEAWDCGHWIQQEKEAEWLSTLGKWLESTRHAVSGGRAVTE